MLRLSSKIQGESHHLYMDNLITSPSLSALLQNHNSYLIGTVCSNRKEFPQSLRDIKSLSKTLQHGQYKSAMIHNGKTECLVWKNNKPVCLINSISNPANVTHVKRTTRDGSRLQVSCPESIKLYNAYMGGVDLFDFRRKTYSSSRKSKKWWLQLFYFLLDMAVTNSFIVHKESPNAVELTQKEFILRLAEHLISCNSPRKHPTL